VPTSVLLELDVTAPLIAWGTVTGRAPGSTLQASYTITEPAVVSAEFQVVTGQTLAMVIGPERLSVQVPENAPDGAGVIRVVVRDDVLNEATYEQPVVISSVGLIRQIRRIARAIISKVTEKVRPSRVRPQRMGGRGLL
jgi:hypothetical protein